MFRRYRTTLEELGFALLLLTGALAAGAIGVMLWLTAEMVL